MYARHQEADQCRFRLGRKDRSGNKGDHEQAAENGEVIHGEGCGSLSG